jgi:hypothetical protein
VFKAVVYTHIICHSLSTNFHAASNSAMNTADVNVILIAKDYDDSSPDISEDKVP